MHRTIAAITALFCLLAVSVFVSAYVWWQLGTVAISTHGKIAMILGIIGTLGLGVGLMRLVYWSHHKGYDERARQSDLYD